MIYLTFDTNIWIYLLDDSWKDNNPLDTLEHWINEELITILLPEIVVEEWKRNKQIEKAKRIKELKQFFNMAEEILSVAFVGDSRKPENLENEVERQFKRIETLIQAKAKLLPFDNSLKDKLIEWAILKKAPMHKKSSMADTVIVFSILKFANENPNDEYYFISANTEDFYSKKDDDHSLHDDLKPEFDAAKIKDFTNLHHLIKKLKEKLPITVDLDKIKRERIQKKSISDVYNPEKLKNLEGVQDLFFENTKQIDFILSSNTPTKHQILSIWGIIDSHESYKQYFYNAVCKPVWFDIFKREGLFNSSSIPDPVQVEQGFQTPYWNVLAFLEKISLQIKDGKSTDLTDELLVVIKDVSEHPKDNYRTWYVFIRILLNLPNEKITGEILNLIPVWLSGKFDASLQSSEICLRLLPKFLNDAPTSDDIEKAELIIHYLFQIEKGVKIEMEIWKDEAHRYVSRVRLHYLTEIFVKQKLVAKVVQHCSADIILKLGRTIKLLLLDHSKGINTTIKDGDKEFQIKALIEKENLLIASKLKESEFANAASTLTNFEELTDQQLQTQLIDIFKKQGIHYVPTDDNFDAFTRIHYALNNDFNSVTGFNSIRKLEERYYSDEKVVRAFALIFRELLSELAEQNHEKAIEILSTICFNFKYRIPFFKRIALYVIGENWREAKAAFWNLVKDKDALHLFSDHKYRKELYDLLFKNQSLLVEEEIKTIQIIISQGEQGKEEETNGNYDYWQLQWCSALRNIEPFKSTYAELSERLNIKHDHYENLGEVRIRSGSISPFATTDLLQKNNAEIANFLKTFQPKDRREGPNISGLSDTLKNAVETEPEKFANEIELYNEIAYIYSYRIFHGFTEAWKKHKTFDWGKVLTYCIETLKDKDFYSGQLKSENDGWNATADWVVGAMANLLTEGMQKPQNAFEANLLPLAKTIVQIIVSNLKPVDDFKGTNMDYPTYSYNSTAGQSLRALLDYAIHYSRSLSTEENPIKWEPEIKSLFESTLSKGIIDGHIMLGMYFEQFYYLDTNWIIEQVKQHYTAEQKNWMAFIGGFAFGNPPWSKEIYDLFYPHYEKAISEDIQLKSFHNHGLIRHLTAFYFWGFEDLAAKKLLYQFLEKASEENVSELVNFIWQQSGYAASLDEEGLKQFEKVIYELWIYLADKYEKSEDEAKQKIMADLCNWLEFAPELSDACTKLVLKSCKHIHKTYSTHELVENIVKLKDKGKPNIVAKNIGKIIAVLRFSDYTSEEEQSSIKTLLQFMKKNGQNEAAIKFCNNMASVYNQYFLRDLHDNYLQSND